MSHTATRSATITSRQIEKIQDLIGSALRESEFPSEGVEEVLEAQGDLLADAFLTEIRKRLEVVSNLIVRHVTVNRTRTPQAALQATGRVHYVDDAVVASMPNGIGEKVDVYFFRVSRNINDADLEKEYELRGLIPADPFSLAAVNEVDPDFAGFRPHGTHWQDKNGTWCFAMFCWYAGERRVRVARRGGQWLGSYWFAGIRK